MTKEAIYRIIHESLQKYEGAIPVDQVTKEIVEKLDYELYCDELSESNYDK